MGCLIVKKNSGYSKGYIMKCFKNDRWSLGV